jgi:hypothetical protein
LIARMALTTVLIQFCSSVSPSALVAALPSPA